MGSHDPSPSPSGAVGMAEEGEEEEVKVKMGSYGGMLRKVWESTEETMMLWGFQQPTLSKPNSFVLQSSLRLPLDACGHTLDILQSPSSLSTPGVTGAVMWDSGVVLGKFLEHAVDTGMLLLRGKKVIELGSGCGLVGRWNALLEGECSKSLVVENPIQEEPHLCCIAALLGAQVILTDLPDRLRLLKKNIEANLRHGDMRGSATVNELIWGDESDPELIEPVPNFVLGSDVIYSEGAVVDLLATLLQLCGTQTTIFLAGELRNDAVLEYFLEAALKDFMVGRVDQTQWHPDYCSQRVVMYVLMKK